ncbi:MAG: nucleotidyltransferase domain-containing protein [Fibromonadales bacterium]|nr:nucleotidyltransferase domain-containing protein [Fibromonadales bacterium]
MRISDFEIDAIVNAIVACDSEAKIWLFGSRTDNSKKGGDIDIGVLSKKIDLMTKLRIRRNICEKIGEQKIDLVVSKAGETAFFKYAVMEEGVALYG